MSEKIKGFDVRAFVAAADRLVNTLATKPMGDPNNVFDRAQIAYRARRDEDYSRYQELRNLLVCDPADSED